MIFPVFWWAKGPPLISLFVLRGSALGVPSRNPHPRMALPLGWGRSHAISLETSPMYQGIYSAGGCHCACGGIRVGHSLLPDSTSWYLALVCWWLLMSAGELPWPPGGPHHVGFFSQWTWTKLPVGWLAVEQRQPHCIGPLPAGWCPHHCKWLISKDKISWIVSSLSWGPHGGGPGDLISRYTSWHRSQISFWEVW